MVNMEKISFVVKTVLAAIVVTVAAAALPYFLGVLVLQVGGSVVSAGILGGTIACLELIAAAAVCMEFGV